MSYKNREDRLALYQRYNKHYIKTYRLLNKEEWNKYQRERKRKIKEELGYDPGRKRIQEDPVKHKRHLELNRGKYQENKNQISKKLSRDSETLNDRYVVKQLAKMCKASFETIWQQPKLIQAYKLLLTIKREIKCQEKSIQ